MADLPKQMIPPPTKIPIALTVNGITKQLELTPWTTLLDALRDHLDLTGHQKRLRPRPVWRMHSAG
jgi:xanthine dehydrogenase YagT iron-sulfur-binding subunit